MGKEISLRIYYLLSLLSGLIDVSILRNPKLLSVSRLNITFFLYADICEVVFSSF